MRACFGIVLSLLFLLSPGTELSARSPRPRVKPSAIGVDPPRDAKYPATAVGMRIPVQGSHINGVLMVASGPGPHPTILLLHGFTGYEGLLDVGEAVRRAGVNFLAFHYRGAWGSEGTFSFGGAVDDAEAALAWLEDPKIAAQGRVDTTRIYAVGHSFGGFVAMRLAARTHVVKGIAYISGWDIVSDVSPWIALPPAEVVNAFDGEARLYGSTTSAALVQELVDHRDDYPLATLAGRVADRPILMTYARFEEEDNAPIRNHEPLRDALRRAGAAQLETRAFATDHGYSDKRIALARTLAEWLVRIDVGGHPL